MYLHTDMNAFSLQLQMQKHCFDNPYNVEYSFEIINYNKKMNILDILHVKLKLPLGVTKWLLRESLRLNRII